MKTVIALAALALLTAVPAAAQREDAEGCKDSSLLSRMNGCTIDNCEQRDFDEGQVFIGLDESGEAKMKSLEGAVEKREYTCPGNISGLAIARNAESALKAAGFGVVYSGKNEFGRPTLTVRKGNVWLNVNITGQDTMSYYEQTIVRTKEMEQQMVSSLEAMEADINSTGTCSVYGILFDTGKSTIKAGSEPPLNEVAKLLKKNSVWKMQVEGHTDNVGTKDANLKLSQARADAVRAWLVTNGIDGARLVAKGFGDTKPVADNASEEGRAKNRRVALLKL
ncbi:MAG TPA: OmpA family protein [Thermoanaerobaculia bacterium]|nr:OmpA family protein [Thermoanaerobaculia bacterium]